MEEVGIFIVRLWRAIGQPAGGRFPGSVNGGNMSKRIGNTARTVGLALAGMVLMASNPWPLHAAPAGVEKNPDGTAPASGASRPASKTATKTGQKRGGEKNICIAEKPGNPPAAKPQQRTAKPSPTAGQKRGGEKNICITDRQGNPPAAKPQQSSPKLAPPPR